MYAIAFNNPFGDKARRYFVFNLCPGRTRREKVFFFFFGQEERGFRASFYFPPRTKTGFPSQTPRPFFVVGGESPMFKRHTFLSGWSQRAGALLFGTAGGFLVSMETT